MSAFREKFKETERLVWKVIVIESKRKEICYIVEILLVYQPADDALALILF